MDETWEDYSLSVMRMELGRALIKLSRSNDVEQELTVMSQRIVNKLNNRVFSAIKSVGNTYNSQESQASYRHNYQDRWK
jgi:glutamyl-tRNA reductase